MYLIIYLIRYLFTVLLIETGLKVAEGEIHKRASTCPRFMGFTGKVLYRRGGHRANFMCLKGAKRYGPRRLDCRVDGTWSGDMPLCLKGGCVPVDISQSPFLDMTEQHERTLLKFTCEGVYQLDGAAESACDGTNWSDPLPKCIATFDVTRCDFEQSLCGWTQDDTDEGEWAKHAGSTQTGNTGPMFDHTHALDAPGHYMFFEASTPIQEGDQARLFSPGYAPDMSPICFGFWYHMLGPDDSGHVGSLEVFILGESQFVEDLNASFYIDGNQGDSWNEGEVVIPPMSETFQIVIEATRKLSYISDIAIDDVGLHNCSHDEMASITTNPTPALTTTIATTMKTTPPAATTKVSPKCTTTTSKPTTIAVTTSLDKTTGRTTNKKSTQISTKASTTTLKATASPPSTKRSTKLSTLPPSTKQTTMTTTTQSVTTKKTKTTIPPNTTKTIATTTTQAATTTRATSTTVSAKPTTTTVAPTTTTTLATTTTTLPPTTRKQTMAKRTKRTPKPTRATKPTPKPTKRTTKMTTTPAQTTIKPTTVPATTKTALTTTASTARTTQTSTTVSPSSAKGSRTSISAPASVSATGTTPDGTGSVTTTNVSATSPAQQATNKAGKTTVTSKTQTSKTTVAVSKVKSHPDNDKLKPLKIGLGVGIVPGLILIGVIAYVCVRRRKFYTSRYEYELKPITKTGSSNSLNNDQYYPDEEYQS